MKIRVLGCDGGVSLTYNRTTSFLINDTIAIDAGSIASALPLDAQRDVSALFLTHAHCDHIRDLPFLAIHRFGTSLPPLKIYGGEKVLATIGRHLFNDKIWPDCTKRPAGRPAVELRPIEAGKVVSAEKLLITAICVQHSFEAFGYLIEDKKSAVIISGDTGPTHALWNIANRTHALKAIFLEVSFPQSAAADALASHHLSTAALPAELHKLKKEVPIFAYHLKPPFHAEIRKEIKKRGLEKRVRILRSGENFEF